MFDSLFACVCVKLNYIWHYKFQRYTQVKTGDECIAYNEERTHTHTLILPITLIQFQHFPSLFSFHSLGVYTEGI